jgi:hypothetical protein
VTALATQELRAVRKTRLKQLLLIGLGHIASGMFFGTGCIIVEHADNIWWPSEDTAQEKTASERKVTPNSATAFTDVASHQ